MYYSPLNYLQLKFQCVHICLREVVTITLSSDVLIVDRPNGSLHSLLFLPFPLLPLQLSAHILRQQGLVSGECSKLRRHNYSSQHENNIIIQLKATIIDIFKQ